MKISAVGMPLHFNGQNNNYKQEMKKKSDTTLKLAIGTAAAGTALLAACCLTRKSPKQNVTAAAGTATQNTGLKQKINEIKDITDKTGKDVLDKLSSEIIQTVNQFKVSAHDFSERLITLLDNGKAKVEYFGRKGGKISKKRIYINPDGELGGTITNYNDGKSIIEKFKHTQTADTRKKIFFDKNHNTRKTQTVVTELCTTTGIPTGYKRTIEINEKGKAPLERVTELSFDMKPQRSQSNGKEIIYGYSASKSGKVIGHAFSNRNKYIVKFINNPKFKKEFDNIESIYSWSKGNFRSR